LQNRRSPVDLSRRIVRLLNSAKGAEKTMVSSLENQALVEQARNEAIARIEAIMLPGAQALCDSRESSDPYWIEHEAEVGAIKLVWRSQKGDKCDNLPSVQIVVRSDAAPEHLARAAIVAADTTRQIIRESDAKRAACASLADALVRDFAAVAVGN
jgi:hypothetical protein